MQRRRRHHRTGSCLAWTLCQLRPRGAIATFGDPDRGGRLLVLGVAPMCRMDGTQWRAALVQGLALDLHDRPGELRLARGQAWIDAGLGRTVKGRERRGLRQAVVRAHARLAVPVCQSIQLRADRHSADLTTYSAARSALELVPATEATWWAFWERHVRPSLALLGRPMDLISRFQSYLEVAGTCQVDSATRGGGRGTLYTPLHMRVEALSLIAMSDSCCSTPRAGKISGMRYSSSTVRDLSSSAT